MNKLLGLVVSFFLVGFFFFFAPPQSAFADTWWTNSGNNIFNTNSGAVSIGTTDPALATLRVVAGTQSAQAITGVTTNLLGVGVSGFASSSQGVGVSGINTSSGNGTGVFASSLGTGWDFWGDGPKTFFGGNVGIKTGDPLGDLDVHGKIVMTNDNSAAAYSQMFSWVDGVNSSDNVDWNLFTQNNTRETQIRIFRATNTTGPVGINILCGNGAACSNSYLSGNRNSYLNNYAGNVGIGTSAPNEKLEVKGGVRLNTTSAKPSCNSSKRGVLWFTQGSTGVKDSLEVCAKDASGSYNWRLLY